MRERNHDNSLDGVKPYQSSEDEYFNPDINGYSSQQKLTIERTRWQGAWLVIVIFLVILAIGSFGYSFSQLSTPTHHAITPKLKPAVPPVRDESLVGQWAYVPETKAITNTFGNVCWVFFGSKDTVVTDNDDAVIVSYQESSNAGSRGSSGCADGTKYSVARSTFRQMDADYLTQRNAYQRDGKYVTDILKKGYYGNTIPAGGEQHVIFMNPTPLSRSFDNTTVQFSNSCVIGTADNGATQGGYIQERGRAPDGRMLYEYIPLGQTYESECPKGTLFFQNQSVSYR